MRDFYRAYEDQPALLSLALQLGWTQNVVILEADLSMELRGWYLKAVKQFGWSKAELIEKIATNAHEMIILAINEEVCYTDELKDKLDALYDALFIRQYTSRAYEVRIGQMSFGSESRATLLRAVSALSQFADFEA